MLFKVFFSRYVMGKFGRDPQFLKEVNMNVSEFIFSKAAEHLASKEAQHNFILHFTLCGNYGEEIPSYVEAGNYERIRRNLKQLRLYSGYIQNASSTYGQFHKMNLSDIFEYLDKPAFETLGREIASTLYPGGRMAYWNLMVPRRISSLDRSINYLADLSESLSKQDKGFSTTNSSSRANSLAMANTLYLAAAFLGLFGIAEWLFVTYKPQAEYTRKFVHIGTGLLSLLFPLLLTSVWSVLFCARVLQ